MIRLVLVVLLFLLNSLSAEEKLPDNFKPGSLGLNSNQKKLFDYLEIERRGNIERRNQMPTTDAWREFSRLYEEYVKLFCYQPPKHLRLLNTPPQLSKSCRFYLGKLETYNPSNPVGICARNGINTEKCRNAFLQQYISQDTDNVSMQNRLPEFEERITSINTEALNIRYDKLVLATDKAALAYQKQENPGTWTKYKNLLSKKIKYNCQDYQVAFVEKEPPGFMLASNLLEHERYANDNLYMQAYELLHDPLRLGNLIQQGTFDKKKKAADGPAEIHPFEVGVKEKINVFRPESFWRIRAVSKKCFKALLEGLKFNPYLPESICSLHGAYSPFCLDAHNRFMDHVPDYIKRPPVKVPKYSLDEF